MANKSRPKKTAARSSTRARHSKSAKKPVTIDLEAKDVKKETVSKTSTTKRSVPSTKSEKKTDIDQKPGKSARPTTASKPSTTASVDNRTKTKPTFGRPETSSATSRPGAGAGGSKNAQPENPAGSSTKSPSSKPVIASQKSNGGWGSQLVAACIGGVIALGLAGLLQYAGILSNPGAVSTADADARSRLENRIAGLESKIPADPSNELAKLVDDQIAPFSASSTKRMETIESSVTKLREQLAALPAGTDISTDIGAKVGELAKQVAALQATKKTADSGNVSDSGSSIGRFEQITATVSKVQKELVSRIDNLKDAVAATDANQASIKTQITEANEKLAGINTTTEQTNAEITALRDRIENGADKRAAAAIAAAALKNDIDNGKSFTASLSNLRAFSPGIADLNNLDGFAQKGIPTFVQLTSEFKDSISDAILKATAPVEDGSLASRLAAGARSLVKVQPIGVVDGDGPEARVSQISAALKSGDLAKASTAWKALPEQGREASAAWHDNLQARLTANTVISGAVENILNSSRGG